jgi:hypothetical protein
MIDKNPRTSRGGPRQKSEWEPVPPLLLTSVRPCERRSAHANEVSEIVGSREVIDATEVETCRKM